MSEGSHSGLVKYKTCDTRRNTHQQQASEDNNFVIDSDDRQESHSFRILIFSLHNYVLFYIFISHVHLKQRVSMPRWMARLRMAGPVTPTRPPKVKKKMKATTMITTWACCGCDGDILGDWRREYRRPFSIYLLYMLCDGWRAAVRQNGTSNWLHMNDEYKKKIADGERLQCAAQEIVSFHSPTSTSH